MLSPVFSAGLDWRHFIVAVSAEGKVIGCGQARPRAGGIREVASIAVERTWRGKGVAVAIVEHMAANCPRPLWGTCTDNFIPFYERFGATEVTDPGRMPPFLRRRRCRFNMLLRLARKQEYLAVMVLE